MRQRRDEWGTRDFAGLRAEDGEYGVADGGPALFEWTHHDRFNEEEDVFFAGVVSADEGATAGVEGALEESSEDGGCDMGPVIAVGDFVEDAHIGLIELDDGVVFEEATVEPTDGVLTEDAVLEAHGGEEMGELEEEAAGIEAVDLDEPAEDPVGEEADGVGEEAEEDAHEEVRDLLLVFLGLGTEIPFFEFEAFCEA
jgi:hypothetical protein